MTDDEVKTIVLKTLGDVAPDSDMTVLKADVNFRDQLDIDSMDFLNFVIALHRKLNIDIPEADYPKLSSLAGCVAYVQAKLSANVGA